MKSFWMLLVLVSLSGVSTLSWAQSQTGNGGRAIVCFGLPDPVTGAQVVSSAKTTDLEESVLSRWNITLGQDRIMTEADGYATALDAVNRLSRLDALLSKELKEIIAQMQSERHLLYWQAQGLTISKIRDANTEVKSINENCLEMQAAFNKTNPAHMEYRFVFIGNIIEKMTNRHLAALILHEALYFREATYGVKNSDSLRKVVRLLSSAELNTVTQREWYEFASVLLKRVLVTDGELTFQGVSKWLPNGRVGAGSLIIPQYVPVSNVLVRAPCNGAETNDCGYQVVSVDQWTPVDAQFNRLESGLTGYSGAFFPSTERERIIHTDSLVWEDGKLIEKGFPYNAFDPKTLNPIQSLWSFEYTGGGKGWSAEVSKRQPHLVVEPINRHLKEKLRGSLDTFVTFNEGKPDRLIVFLKTSQWMRRKRIRFEAGYGGNLFEFEVKKYEGIEFKIVNYRVVGTPEVVELPEAIRNL